MKELMIGFIQVEVLMSFEALRRDLVFFAILKKKCSNEHRI